ncbi:Kinesin-like protein [Handroanthus impetiginosus]|uniref:Kinesin-like protein n=1 Tax=Handroanthus impetiginosus TaxID=429701 RepID=A0A2G9HLY6_9LAMI|nr:Kinesin-like protein [Handroanthus impetiginosus]
MNVYSSRSHTIFRMIIESRDRTDDAQAEFSCDAVRVSVLNLVDLAGSERAAKTGAEGIRLKEGSHINKSLMTLGTVIKKLSEGAESNGGHVPYRDSKLTRILQPALGGNANTAIICNITLAQIHADETKSSLQFASRALRVTNCAHVNEILTDAALLKRQKKEIEELRAKLQGLHSEHLEEEILNLRNTLLKSELERERMALELEEEKRAQAERERMLQEQAKRIENLSSMAKRRDTWCPGNLARKKLKELSSVVKEDTSEVKSTRADRTKEPLLPFEDLLKEASTVELSKQDKDCTNIALEDCTLPDPNALLHVTSRRKVPPRKRSLPTENNDLAEMQVEYENLLLKFETHRIISDIQIDRLMSKLGEADLVVDKRFRESTAEYLKPISQSDGNRSLRDSDAIIETKLLQDKEESDWLTSLSMEAQEIKLEFENSRHLAGSLSSIVDELLHDASALPNLILDLRPSVSQSLVQMESIVRSHEKVQSYLRSKICELKDEKLVLYNQASELQSRIEELSLEVQNSANALMELNEKHEAEKSEFFCQLQILQKELSSFSSCSLAKEKESIRKDLEKTKSKLKDTESKLKNAVQEKTKLEGEKAFAERELKRLQNQKALLERDMNKRESTLGRRRDSTIVRSSNVFDQKRAKDSAALIELEEEYKKLEVLAFEMETTIASLEDQLAMANGEKDAASSRAESLASNMEALSDELQLSNSELSTLKEEVSDLRTSLEESRFHAQTIECSLKTLTEEKEELSMQLTEALLTMEEEKAIWSSKEKASVEVIGEKEKLYTTEIASLSEKLSEARNELENCRKNCKDLEEWSRKLEENGASEKQCRCFKERSSDINLCTDEQGASDEQIRRSPEILDAKLESTSQKTCEEIEILQLELSVLRQERQYLLAQVQELEAARPVSTDDSQVLKLKQELEQQSERLASMEDKMCNDQINKNKEMAKLRMRLRGAQTKLDTFRVRYQESVDELEYMNRKYEEASTKLKKQLASYGSEVLNLKKQLVAFKGQEAKGLEFKNKDLQ